MDDRGSSATSQTAEAAVQDLRPGFESVTRNYGAVRVLGARHRGPLTFLGLRGLIKRLEAQQAQGGVEVVGPLFTVLESDPSTVPPAERRYMTCMPIRGPMETRRGLVVEQVRGGTFVVLLCPGPLAELERAFVHLERFLPERGLELSGPEQTAIRQIYTTPPGDREDDLVTELAVPVVLSMRTDTMRNQH